MPGKPRRRFPFLALLAVVVLGALIVYLAVATELLPRREELWIDLQTGETKRQLYVCDLRCRTMVPEYHNEIAARYALLRPERECEPRWTLCLSTYEWLGGQLHERTPYFRLTEAMFCLSGDVRESERADPSRCFDEAAASALILRFVSLMRDEHDPEMVADYYWTNTFRAQELKRSAGVDDLILIDTWLADPTPEHYYGPERIH